jgi:RNA polymerase-binding transcription factor DksA
MARLNQWRSDREGLRDVLEEHRRQLTDSIQGRMARLRENGSEAIVGKEPDDGDPCDLDVRLLEIAVGTLRRIDAAVARLDHGRYGRCTRCGGPIAEVRLRAMPFALCCQRCQAAGEHEAQRGGMGVRKQLMWAEGHVTND